ncbi:RT0821/Lpp0805 family surface protein [Bdellovibrio sp. HCB274]|uniref:RT0821/Lpp0805 family surface protein n=1 Tax=Bdellovibrio sp. HCB274 TaxID=3394361 RepID=UPI0039B48DF9
MKKNHLVLGAALFASVMQTSTIAQAAFDKGDVGTIIGGVIGGVAGSGFGKGNGKTAATIIGAIAGSVIGNKLGQNMEENDRRAYNEAQRRSLEGNVGESCDWDGGRYGSRSGARGSFNSIREGYNSRGEYCREYVSVIEMRGRTERTQGIACQSRNGSWSETRTSDVSWGGRPGHPGRGDGGYGPGPRPPGHGGPRPPRPMPPPPHPGDRYDRAEVQVSSITRRTGGEWVRLSLAYPQAVDQIQVRTLTAGVRVHDAIVYTQRGQRLSLYTLQGRGTMFAGQSAISENFYRGDRVTAIDVRLESMGGYADVLLTVFSLDGYPNINVSRF